MLYNIRGAITLKYRADNRRIPGEHYSDQALCPVHDAMMEISSLRQRPQTRDEYLSFCMHAHNVYIIARMWRHGDNKVFKVY